MIHPDDENGDVLRRMEAQGDTLTQPRDIDFTVVLPDESAAGQFEAHFRNQGLRVSVKHPGIRPEFPWEVLVVKHMVPSHQDITDFETELQTLANTLGGHNDGWGCFAQKG